MRGALVDGQCWARPSDGAQALCAKANGLQAGYMVTCDPQTVVVPAEVVGQAAMQFSMRKCLLTGNQSCSNQVWTGTVAECQYIGRDEYFGIGSLVFVGALTILGIKRLARLFHARETL